MDGGRLLSRAGLASLRDARRPGRLVPRERVLPVLALAVLGAAVTGLLGVHVGGERGADRIDDVLEGLVDTVAPMRSGVGRVLGEIVADLGSPVATAVIMVAVAVFAYLRCGPRSLALVLTGPPVAMITTTTILKPIIGRTRGDELAYPSGHTTSSTSIAIALVVIVLSLSLPPKRRRWSLVVLVVLPVAVAICLVGREYHYPTDAVGAVGVALASVLLAAVVVDAMADSMADEPHQIGGSDGATAHDPAQDGRPAERRVPRGVPVGGAAPMGPAPRGRPMPPSPPGMPPIGPVGSRPGAPVPAGPPGGAPAPNESGPDAPETVAFAVVEPPAEPAVPLAPADEDGATEGNAAPVAREAEPASDAPEPAVSEPESASAELEPAAAEPVPASAEPEPASAEPVPASGAPDPEPAEASEPGTVAPPVPDDEPVVRPAGRVPATPLRRSPHRRRSLAPRPSTGPGRDA